MISRPDSEPDWGPGYRLAATEKWKAKSAAMGQHVTNAIVDYARPTPGMRALDLASGTGEPAISLASRVGAQGHVTALDMSADLLEVAAQRAHDRGLTNFKTQQADAHNLPFPDNSFDLVTSRFGVMFFRDPELAFREVLRVSRPGARACFLVWASADQPYWSSTVGVVQRHVGGPLIEPGGADPFRFAASGSLSASMQTAGFKDVHEEARDVPWTWPGTPEEIWEQIRTTAVACKPLLERVPAGDWPRLDGEVIAAVRRYFDGENVVFGASVILASGMK
jgi:SAM-dependent methyltransferase